jgi:hypothetical protein
MIAALALIAVASASKVIDGFLLGVGLFMALRLFGVL